MNAKNPATPEIRPCAAACEGCRLGKHACGGTSCDGWGCCACQGETSLAIHTDTDQGGCRDPHVWEGDASLKWYAAGRLVGEEAITFGVECSALPEDDRLADYDLRRLVALQLVCDHARRQYGAPPTVITVLTNEDRLTPSPVDLPVSRARWRLDARGYCHGSGIMSVAAPPSGARLTNVKEAGR
ncbi:hypothetical protein ACFW2V_13840 [Streptomyces sp. NPDC058947]|uniref:hypothetical protein n=1 Tax=Streptomyces sp. NPDC058947 TaxID=3346675 RepID=UPI0036C7BBA2